MKKYFFVFAALALVLAVPFLLRPVQTRARGPVDGTLTIISPHVESIRSEFTLAFQRHMLEKFNRHVDIQWLTPGGTSEIDKYLDTEYRAAFENHWKETQKEVWKDYYAGAVAMSKMPNDADPKLKQARETFLNSNLGVKIDLFFGGGTHDFERQKKKGYLVATDVTGEFGPAAIKKVHPDWFTDAVIPQSFGGQTLYDSNLCWIGNCLSSFGIVYNADILERLNVYEPPRQWKDLANPNYAGYIALADPGKSGSAAMAFEMILQQQIQQAVAQAKKQAADPAAVSDGKVRTEEQAIRYGWNQGMMLIQRIAANARYFTDSAPRPPEDVARGEAAAGMCIDFYGKTFVEKLTQSDGTCRVVYLTPQGGSSVSADPIAMFRGAPNPELATQFIEFVLSMEGQRLWGYRSKTPGGPEGVALRRQPIRKDFYIPAERKFASDPKEMPYEQTTFVYEPKYSAAAFNALRVIIRAMCLDTREELKGCWKALSDNEFPPTATQNFSDLNLISYDKVMNNMAGVFNGGDKIRQARLARDLAGNFRNQYLNATEMALRRE